MTQIVKIKDASFSYGNTLALKNINFSLYQNDFIGIIGPNGGGKSTFIKLLLGILSPTSGSISYPNSEIFNKLTQVGYVAQNTNKNLNYPILAKEVIEMGFLQKRLFGFRTNKDNRKKALEVMDMLNILNLADKKISSLSGGELQKVLLARAICGEAKLIILDEPTSNIDSKSQSEIYKILELINKTNTIITISHDISITLQYASRILHINEEIVEHKIPNINVNRSGHVCEIDIFQDLINISEGRSV